MDEKPCKCEPKFYVACTVNMICLKNEIFEPPLLMKLLQEEKKKKEHRKKWKREY